jgi:Ala-tRNA(Pro) deacylase
VTPFGALNDTAGRVTVVLDKGLMEHAAINCHPLVNTMTTTIAREGLIRFLLATGHKPRIEPIAEPAAR